MTGMTTDDVRALYDAARAAGGAPLLLDGSGLWLVNDLNTLRQIAEASRMPSAGGFSAAARASGERPKTGVQVIPLTGVITPHGSFFDFLFGGSGGLTGFQEQLRAAVSNDDVTAIVLDVDSPGGMADLVPETAAAVREARTVKNVVSVANTMMGSAAYWIASQASEVVTAPSGYVGSIGVYRMHVDSSGLDELMGVNVTYVSAGKYKTEGNPHESLGQTGKRAWQTSVDEVYADFTADVAAGRGVSVDAVRSGYGEGRMLRGAKAVAAGLADRVDTYEGVVSGLLGGALPPPEPPQVPTPDDEEDGDDASGSDGPQDAAASLEARLIAARLLTAR